MRCKVNKPPRAQSETEKLEERIRELQRQCDASKQSKDQMQAELFSMEARADERARCEEFQQAAVPVGGPMLATTQGNAGNYGGPSSGPHNTHFFVFHRVSGPCSKELVEQASPQKGA